MDTHEDLTSNEALHNSATRRFAGAGRANAGAKTFKAIVVLAFIALGAMFAANLLSPTATANSTRARHNVSGAELFQNNCARCHGPDGKGGKGPNLASEKRQAKWRDSDAKLVKKITNGGLIMPSFKKKLTPEEIQAIADHVRTLKE